MKSKGRERKDISGQRFGMLTVLELSDVRTFPSGQKESRWACRCDCGGSAIVSGRVLKRGTANSCGCFRKQKTYRHGMAESPLYRRWANIIQRCTNPNNPGWENYGGRGIAVCDRWRDSFAWFEQDMADGYADGLTIDRIDPDGDYEPGNCRWATVQEQARNKSEKRGRRAFVAERSDGTRRTLKKWAALTGIPYITLWRRICVSGWDVDRALTQPPHAGGRKK